MIALSDADIADERASFARLDSPQAECIRVQEPLIPLEGCAGMLSSVRLGVELHGDRFGR